MYKTILCLGLMVASVSASFAGSPEKKGDSEKSKASGTTYYITGTTTKDGQPAYTFDQVPQSCDGASLPCQFTTLSGTLTSPQLQSKINGEQGVVIDAYRD